MDSLISIMTSLWSLMWLPLQSLSFDNVIIVCPLILLIFVLVFGTFFNLFRGF